PPDVRDGLGIAGLPAELAHLRDRGVEVGRAEVDEDARRSARPRVDRAAAFLRHLIVVPVLERSELPAEQTGIEGPRTVAVLAGDLEPVDLAVGVAHWSSFP